MKLVLDFFPIILFFITYKYYGGGQEGILAATVVIIVATIVQVAITWLWKRRVEKMHLITLALVVIFGGATLILKDEIFIKWKPTVVNWIFAIGFLASQFIGERNLVQRMMDKSVDMPNSNWRTLNLIWVVFFIVLGFVNLYVVYNFDTDTWVNFKLYGLIGLTLIFALAQGFYVARHMAHQEDSGESG